MAGGSVCVLTWEELFVHGDLARHVANLAAVCFFSSASPRCGLFDHPGWRACTSYRHQIGACLDSIIKLCANSKSETHADWAW